MSRRFTLRLGLVFAASLWLLPEPVYSQSLNLPSSLTGAISSGTSTSGSTSSSSSTGGTTSSSSTSGSSGSGLSSGPGVSGPDFIGFGESTQPEAGEFVGRGSSSTFVGNQNAGQQAVNVGATPQFGPGFGNQGLTDRQGAATTGKHRGQNIRFPIRIAFTQVVLPAATVQSNLQTQFQLIETDIPGVTARITPEGTAILQGTVDSVGTRKLAAAIARLEPGVRNVQNELQVAGQ